MFSNKIFESCSQCLFGEAALLYNTEVQLGAVRLLSTGSDVKISTASFINIQRYRLFTTM